MLTKEFLRLLKENPGKELVFEYQESTFVPPSYHITEVKNLHIDSVDCGGRPSERYETVVQLWLPEDEKKERAMETEKALKIFDIVNRMKPMRPETDLFIEWGHGSLRTSNYAIEAVEETPDRLVFKMFVPATACKPKLELAVFGGDCKEGSGCC